MSLIPFFRRLISEILCETVGTNIRLHQRIKAAQQTVDYIDENMLNVKECTSRYELFDFALESIANKDGMYLEFGVFMGDSINYMSTKINKREFHGFDSFDGLPEYWEPGYEKGALAIKDKGKLKFEKNVVLHVGWFEDTLPKFVESTQGSVALLHIDADLYSSTVTVFQNLKDRIEEGTIIVFDEYFNFPNWQVHEFRAFQEFCTETGLKYDHIAYNVFSGQVAVKVIGYNPAS